MAQHTPGEWAQHPERPLTIWVEKSRQEIATCLWDDAGGYAPVQFQAMENARLLAAAKRMLGWMRRMAPSWDEEARKILADIDGDDV